jgi:CRISPR-associated protein Csb3
MARHTIPVDFFNPGQVFACLGFVEVALMLFGDARGGFDWRDAAKPCFHLMAGDDRNPFDAALEFLAEAKVASVAPAGSEQSTAKWNVPTIPLDQDAPYPFPEPPSPATLPAVLTARSGKMVTIDHWGEASERTGRDSVKFWAGAGGYPGAALALDALDLIRERLREAAADPFSVSVPQSSSFRFDWRRDYIPLHVGFSPNEHGDVVMMGYPLVEILAAIGLANARPMRGANKLEYRYGILGISADEVLFDPIFLRAALGAAALPFPQRRFRMLLGWPGQENQARCITDVTEETVL